MPRFTTSDGAEINYLDRQGSADVLVLVHGYTGSSGDWTETLPRLPADWRVIQVDLRGAGESSHPDAGYTIERYTADIFELVTSLELPPFVLIGHSMGGAIAAQFTLAHQEILRGTILLAPAPLNGLTPPDPAMMQQMEQFRGNVEVMKQLAQLTYSRTISEEIVERSVMASLKISEGHRKQSLDSMVNLRLGDLLTTLKLPVLIVGGDRDNLVPVQTMLDAYTQIPNCGLQIYQRVGHMVQQEVPDDFAALTVDFVAHSARKGAATPQAVA
jgi:pimeloyl-ACP methyl ester carboxylesterase